MRSGSGVFLRSLLSVYFGFLLFLPRLRLPISKSKWSIRNLPQWRARRLSLAGAAVDTSRGANHVGGGIAVVSVRRQNGPYQSHGCWRRGLRPRRSTVLQSSD